MRHEKSPRKRARVGRGAPQILVRCPQQIFQDLHKIAEREHKTLNLTAIEMFQIGLAVEKTKSPIPSAVS